MHNAGIASFLISVYRREKFGISILEQKEFLLSKTPNVKNALNSMHMDSKLKISKIDFKPNRDYIVDG